MLNDEQLKTLLEAAELAARLKDGRSDEARSKALIRFHYEFSSPSMCAELVREVLRLQKFEAEIKQQHEDTSWDDPLRGSTKC